MLSQVSSIIFHEEARWKQGEPAILRENHSYLWEAAAKDFF